MLIHGQNEVFGDSFGIIRAILFTHICCRFDAKTKII
jgi:hypothetical protein